MQKQVRIMRSLLCLLITAAMIMGLIPGQPRRALAAEPVRVSEDDAGDILGLESETPDELGDYPSNVYDVKPGQEFLLSEQNELALLIGDLNAPAMNRYDTFGLNMIRKDSSGQCWVNGINNANAQSNDPMPSSKLEMYKEMLGMQSVGLDRDGTGRKQYTATVGFFSGVVTLVVQNAVTGTIKIYAVQTADWSSNIPYWLADNYLAITAGDYDGDGQDSIVVYVCGDGDEVKLMEFYPSSTGGWSKRTILKLSSVLKLKDYQEYGNYNLKPTVSLATGDFNGDGKDQLAFSAGYYNTSNSVTDGYDDVWCDSLEYFASCVGICSQSGGWSLTDTKWMYDIGTDFTQEGNEKTYPLTVMHAACIAAGDVNNDGIDEIVAAGYMSKDKDDDSTDFARGMYIDGALKKVYSICDWSDKLVDSVIYAVTGENGTVTYSRTKLEPFQMSRAQKYTYTRYCREEDRAFVKLAMACGKTNGNNTAEDVFISGIVYDFSDLTATVKYAPPFLNDSDMNKTTGGEGKNSSVTWIRNVSAGNFNGGDAGREQFVFTLWQKYYGQNKYSANVGVITGVEFDDSADSSGNVTSFGPPKYYACNLDANDIMNNNKPYTGNDKTASQLFVGGSPDSFINAVPIAVDIDDDGVKGKFSKSGCVYTDPEVLAVLEAGPYYYEINDAGGYEDPCETSYGIAIGYGTANSRSDNVSFEVGVALEAGGPTIKTSLEMGYAMDWSHSYETAYMVTTELDWGAQSEDLVVICRIPQLVYTYDLWDPAHNTWIENGCSVRVPLSPRYFTLGIDEYNEFVDEYNDIVGENSQYALNKIVEGVDLPADHKGNPDKYWSSWTMAGEGGQQLSSGVNVLGYRTGHSSIEYETSAEQTETQEISHGFHYGLTMQGGAELVVGEAWAGGYTNLDYSHSTGCTKTKVNLTKSGGQVQNIYAAMVQGLTEAEVKSSYAFNWTFGKWTRALSKNGTKTPFYGYTVFGNNGGPVKRRAMPPEIGNAAASAMQGYGTFNVTEYTAGLDDVLTVTKLSGDSHITYDSSAKAIRIAAGLKAGTYNAQFKISNGLTALDTTFPFRLDVYAEPCVIKGCSLELEGKLGIRLRMTVPDSAEKALLEFQGEFPETVEFDLIRDAAHGYNAGTGEFTLIYRKIAAKEMTCPLTLKVVAADGTYLMMEKSTAIGTDLNMAYTACVADWAAYAAVNASGTDTRNLAKSLLNYGGAAQKYFRFNTANPANPKNYLKTETQNVTPDAALNRVIPKDAYTKLGYTGMALNLEGDTELQIKFSKKVTATLNGKSLTVKKSGTSYIVSIPGIAAVDLDKMMSIKVTYGSTTLTFKACALSWCNAAIAGSSNADLITMCKAMYLYNKYAEIYFNKEE